MTSIADISTGKVIEGWLRDIGCTPVAQNQSGMNWAYQFVYPPTTPMPLTLTVANPLDQRRGVYIGCRISPSPEHVTVFNELTAQGQKDFWQQLRDTLNRDSVEFQIDGLPTNSCPTAFQIGVMRYDDGLTLDSFARGISAVLKACIDGIACFRDRLSDVAPAPGNDPSFRKLGTQ